MSLDKARTRNTRLAPLVESLRLFKKSINDLPTAWGSSVYRAPPPLPIASTAVYGGKVNTQALRSILIGIISNLITPFAIPVLAFIVGWFFTVSVESKLALLNTALILFLIFFLLYLHFSPKRLLIVRQSDRPEIYLIEKGIYRHIPDGETFDYLGQLFGFQWTDVNVMTPIEFKEKFSAGSILPSILPHCEKYCKKLRDEDSKQAKHKETMS